MKNITISKEQARAFALDIYDTLMRDIKAAEAAKEETKQERGEVA